MTMMMMMGLFLLLLMMRLLLFLMMMMMMMMKKFSKLFFFFFSFFSNLVFFSSFLSIPIVQATGKLDKNALPPFEKESEEDTDNGVLPSTETEKTVAAMWTKVLKIRHVDTEESFFDLGG